MAMEPLEAESLEDGPLEKGSLESGTVPGEPPADQGSTLPGGPFPGTRKERGPYLGVLFILGLLLTAAWAGGLLDLGEDPSPRPTDQVWRWEAPLGLERALSNPLSMQADPEGAIGYEPSLAVDSQGNLFYTAHKDLAWQASWDYAASWFFVSQDEGRTWGPPNDWGLFDQGSEWLGDEGDIGIDAHDRVYFDDTTLLDNWLHIWDDGGDTYVRSQPLGSSGLDDRPWITAQGDGVVHYLGNWAVDAPGCDLQAGRYWYYRSTDGGLTFSQCIAVPGGWTHIDAERDGQHTYMVQETMDTNDYQPTTIQARVSNDQGATWAGPMIIGERAGNPPEGFPWVSTGPASNEGLVAAIWSDAVGGVDGPWEIHVAMSWDYGVTWQDWDITPFEGFFLYPTIYVGPQRTVGVAFYGLEGAYETGNQWYLYGGMLMDPVVNQTFPFTRADPTPLHTVKDYEVSNSDFHALHDFFEIAISPDLALNIAYQHNVGSHPFEPQEEQRYLYFVRGAFGLPYEL